MTPITDAQIKRLWELMTKRDAANAAWSTAPYDPNARLHHDKCVGVLAHEAIKYLPALLDALESRATHAPVAVDEAARALIAALDNSFWGNSMGGILAGRNRLAAALGKPAPVAVDEAKCIWVENDDGINEGTCGVMWEFIAGGVLDNMVKFCPQCGKSVAIGQGAKAGEVGK